MAAESATTTYLVPEPFERALKALRKVLAAANLRIAGELDMSRRIRESLRIGIAPLRLLFIAPAAPALDQLEETGAVALTPLHIVLSGRGPQTEIHLLRMLPVENGPLDGPTMDAFHRSQNRIARAVERIAMRSPVV